MCAAGLFLIFGCLFASGSVAKLVERLLATTALRILSKIQNGCHKQRSGQHTVARQKIFLLIHDILSVQIHISKRGSSMD
jgi:hypothetical protein